MLVLIEVPDGPAPQRRITGRTVAFDMVDTQIEFGKQQSSWTRHDDGLQIGIGSSVRSSRSMWRLRAATAR
jgi:hypothetical protein